MTTYEALVSMSMLLLRQRGQWQGGATAYADIDFAVNRCSDLLPDGSRELCDMAVAELKRRSGCSEEVPTVERAIQTARERARSTLRDASKLVLR